MNSKGRVARNRWELVVWSILVLLALAGFAYRAWAAPTMPIPATPAGWQTTPVPPTVPPGLQATTVQPASAMAGAVTPGVVSYQGTLTDASGKPVNGTVNMTFRLYAAPTGGTALWTEAHTGANAVPVSNGLFNVLLGSLTPIPSEVWSNATLYLGVQVGSDAEMAPREAVGAVPVAASATQARADFQVPGSLIVQGGASIASPWPGPSIGTGLDLGEYTIGDGTGHLYQILGVQRTPQSTPGNPEAAAGGFGIVSGVNQAAPVIWLYGWGGRNEFRVLRRYYGTDIANEAVLFAVDANGNGRFAGSISHGASIENNLQTPSELASPRIDYFSQGDLLCWDIETERLAKCAEAATFLVQAVADANGKPIVLGAESVKVLGPVAVGDLLVASGVPGYAMAWHGTERPPAGAVIAQALAAFEGEQGLVKAMIRKF